MLLIVHLLVLWFMIKSYQNKKCIFSYRCFYFRTVILIILKK